MGETYEVNLLRNVQAVDGKSSVSKDFAGLTRRRIKDKKKRGAGYNPRQNLRPVKHGVYETEHAADDEDEGSIDITV